MAKLHFYYSAMNAGKSTALLQSNYNYRERGMHTLLFAPAVDDRYGVGKITSRIGLAADATPFSPEFDFFAYTEAQLNQSSQQLACVLVDEAQFLNRQQVYQLTEIADQLNIPVLAYGLRSNYKGEPFVGSQYLLTWAGELTEIKTVCHCGRKAIMNMRVDASGNKIADGPDVVIGGNDQYVSTCLKHFKLGDAGPQQLELEQYESNSTD